ncbi:hypothetical protein [Rhodanobacter geophilus]|uniref:DoxX family protein n=1 Tax=Rhodanobacter geophilus TaxID=3162488 RepID=A0ABV3QMA6_9GAMM
MLFAAAMIALGATGLVNGDLALAWQQVPIHRLPARTAIAYACAIIELALGIGLLFKRTRPSTCRVLFPYMVLWLVWLEVPGVALAPQDIGNWGSLGEIAIITAGACCLFAGHSGTGESRRHGFLDGSGGIRAARWLLVVALPMIGAEVIVDAVNAGDRVMQPWLQWWPSPMGWACLTGIGSIATCLALLLGVWPRFAATAEAAMLGVITVAYWAPDLYTGRTATTALIISFLITAGVWLVADTYRNVPWFASGRPVWKT